MAIYRMEQHVPVVPGSAWVAESASVIGRVELGEEASIWYGATLRGDNDRIVIGARSNVQESSVLHTDAGIQLVVGNDVTIGHQVMLHGCTIGDGTLIGIQAIVLNGARIGRHCLVGAGALVTEGKEFPDGSLIVGSPAKVVRALEPAQIERLMQSAQHYVEQARRHRAQCARIDVR
jgi:carbonic anhydrase/acetyltransferase-like protein (isoleucine patch superfamily)